MFSQLQSLTIASLKMFYRNKTAVFFSLFIPLFIIVIFGLLLNNNNTKFAMGITDNANNYASQSFINTLKRTNAFDINAGTYDTELGRLKTGDEDFILVIPENFTAAPNSQPNTITGYYDKGKSQTAQTAFLIIQNILLQYNEGIYTTITHQKVPQLITLEQKGIATNNLTTIDFLIPGIIAFCIMQLGLFSVSFAFTTMKKTGALKRLHATPAKPSNFILAQSIARIILSFIQVLLLLGIGIYFFHLHMYGNILLFLGFVLLGSIVFLSMGFAVAGWARDENQAAPVTNLISFPMMFLSGVFFSRSLMPDFLKHITDYLPLTYLSDALREIANNGAGIMQIRNDLLGLLIWAIIGMIIAIRLFKWE